MREIKVRLVIVEKHGPYWKESINFEYYTLDELLHYVISLRDNNDRYMPIYNADYETHGGRYIKAKDQYTGLKDMDKKEAYDHDLFRHLSRNERRPIEIIWEDGSWKGQYLGTDFKFPLIQWELDDAKIIGNIYENPDLLNCPTNADISDKGKEGVNV